jgi:hypothetical protein
MFVSIYIPGYLNEIHAKIQVVMNGLDYYSGCSDSQNGDLALFKLIKQTNINRKDAACLCVVITQHPASHPSINSTHNKIFSPTYNYLSPLPVGINGKSTQ